MSYTNKFKLEKFNERRNVLIVAPSFQTYIRDPSLILRSFNYNFTVLIPIPRFSIVASLPYLKNYYGFINTSLESKLEKLDHCNIFYPKFFTLPLEVIRRRNSYLSIKNCIETIKKNNVKIDLIHAHTLNNGITGVKIKQLYNKPLVITAHGSDVYESPFIDQWYNNLSRYVLNQADQIITVSKFNEKILLSLGASSNKLQIIPNGYDEKIFKPMNTFKTRKFLNLPLNKKILLSVGNLVRIKGHSYLIDAFNLLQSQRKDLFLIILGSGPLRKELQYKIKKLDLEEKVILAGGKAHNLVPFWLNSCDVFILPSLNEGFPTVIPEALACGKPVIASNVGGVSEIISNKNVGMLIKPKNVKALAYAVSEGIENRWEPQTIIEYSKSYSWDRLVKKIDSVYEKVS